MTTQCTMDPQKFQINITIRGKIKIHLIFNSSLTLNSAKVKVNLFF